MEHCCSWTLFKSVGISANPSFAISGKSLRLGVLLTITLIFSSLKRFSLRCTDLPIVFLIFPVSRNKLDHWSAVIAWLPEVKLRVPPSGFSVVSKTFQICQTCFTNLMEVLLFNWTTCVHQDSDSPCLLLCAIYSKLLSSIETQRKKKKKKKKTDWPHFPVL